MKSTIQTESPAAFSIWREIVKELDRAELLYPSYPTDPVHAVAILAEEAGEVVKAVNDAVTKGKPTEDCRKEAIQAAAMAFRFLKNFEQYNWKVRY